MRRRLLPVLTLLSLLAMAGSLVALRRPGVTGMLTPRAWLAGKVGFGLRGYHDHLQIQFVQDFTGERRRHGRQRQSLSDVDDLRIRDRVLFNAMPALGVAHADYAFAVPAGPRGVSTAAASFRYSVIFVHYALVAALSAVLPAVWVLREVRRRVTVGRRGFPVEQRGSDTASSGSGGALGDASL